MTVSMKGKITDYRKPCTAELRNNEEDVVISIKGEHGTLIGDLALDRQQLVDVLQLLDTTEWRKREKEEKGEF